MGMLLATETEMLVSLSGFQPHALFLLFPPPPPPRSTAGVGAMLHVIRGDAGPLYSSFLLFIEISQKQQLLDSLETFCLLIPQGARSQPQDHISRNAGFGWESWTLKDF